MIPISLLLVISALARATLTFGFVQISPSTNYPSCPTMRRPSIRRTSTSRTANSNALLRMTLFKSSSPSSLGLLGGSDAAGPASGFFHEPSSFLSSVEFFDGSSVVDPVVVSGAFWTSLKAKLFSLVLGQLAATVVFGLIVFVAASQLGKLTENVSSTFLQQDRADASTTKKRFRKFPESQSPPVQIQQEDVVRLLISLLVDVIGTSSEVVPVVGELSDLVWAPIAGIIVRSMYGSNVVLIFEVAEEILPFTDFLPFATICWVVDVFFADSELARALRIGVHRSVSDATDSSPINGDFPAKARDRVFDVKAMSVEDEINRLQSSEQQQQPKPGDGL